MAKKWKAYPWPDRNETIEVEDDEEIDVVGDSPANKQATATCWGPSSPTAGATAPSPPPHSPKGSTILYNGKSIVLYSNFPLIISTWLSKNLLLSKRKKNLEQMKKIHLMMSLIYYLSQSSLPRNPRNDFVKFLNFGWKIPPTPPFDKADEKVHFSFVQDV